MDQTRTATLSIVPALLALLAAATIALLVLVGLPAVGSSAASNGWQSDTWASNGWQKSGDTSNGWQKDGKSNGWQ